MDWILVVNVGSTSVKTALFAEGLKCKAALDADHAQNGWRLHGQGLGGVPVSSNLPASLAVEEIVAGLLQNWRSLLQKSGVVLTAIGHRVVHGGVMFQQLTPISPEVLAQLPGLDAYAPLHNPINRLGITLAANTFPATAQFAVFDTAFHHTLPEHAKRYAIPKSLSVAMAFQRFGFHGISCQHSVATAAQLLETEISSLNLIVLHLGGGASITAVRAGQSADTSMGFSPLEGLVMASRCGDLDPAIVLALQKQGWSAEQTDTLLNHESGLLGLCGETDMRVIIDRAELGDSEADLAIALYCHRIKKYIGAYCAVLGQVSALVFTGGVGEHAAAIRAKTLAGLERFGFDLDKQANLNNPNNSDISLPTSASRILVIHAEEEREIARQIDAYRATTPTLS